MGFLSFGNKKSAPTIKEFRGKLPSIHSFVEVAVRNGPNGSVCFEKTGPTTFVTSALPGMLPGQRASFNYQTTDGKYRFSAAVKAVDARQATFELPLKIETVQKFGGSQKRTTVRIDTTVAMQWRYSSAGRIQTEWHKGVLSDISRTGSSLASDREIKIGTVIELRMSLLPDGGSGVDQRRGSPHRQHQGEVEVLDRLELRSAHLRGRSRHFRVHQPPPSGSPGPRSRVTGAGRGPRRIRAG